MQDSSNFKIPFAETLFLLFALLAACGKVGPPQPPFIRIPEPVKDLAVIQSGHDLVVTWTNPARYIDGSAATNLARVQIRTRSEVLTTVNVSAAGQLQTYSMPVGPDTNRERTFTVVVETTQGKLSEMSNVAAVTPVEVPGRVSGLMATPDQRRVSLQWNKPQDHPELVDAYLVIRTDTPTEVETLTDARFDDTRYQEGAVFTYHVTPARRVAGALVMGVGPETVTITIQDKSAPMVPSGLDIKHSDTGAYLTWEPNTETDLAGYQLFRSESADGGFRSVSDRPIMTNGFFDPSYRPGLYYSVSAVDESGNESARSAPFRGP
jgi:hypothetical protein